MPAAGSLPAGGRNRPDLQSPKATAIHWPFPLKLGLNPPVSRSDFRKVGAILEKGSGGNVSSLISLIFRPFWRRAEFMRRLLVAVADRGTER